MLGVTSGVGWLRETGGVLAAVLNSPSLRRVLLAFLLYTSLLWGTWVAIVLWAVAAMGTAQVGIAATVQLLPAAVFAAVAATLADRYARRRVLPLGYLGQGLGFGAAGIGMLAAWPAPVVLALLALGTCATTVTRPAQGALLPELARTPAEATAANALVGMTEGVGVLAGPLVAAGILLARPVGDVLLAGAGAAFLAAALVVRLPHGRVAAAPVPEGDPLATPPSPVETESAHGGNRRRDPMARILGGLKALTGSRDVAVIVGVLGLRMLLSGMLDILVVLLALDLLGVGASGAGALQASFGLGTVLGGAVSMLLVGRRRLAWALAASAALVGVPLIALGILRLTLVAPVMLASAGIGFATVDIAGRTILQRVADPNRLATVLGSLEGVGLVALSAGSLLAPALAGSIGVGPATAVAGALLPLAVATTWLWLRSIDRRASVPVREIALLRANAIFSPLPAPQLEAVASRVQWLTVKPGVVVIREGDPGDRYLILVEGALRVTQAGRLLRDLDQPGSGAGEIALLRDIPRTATVTVTEPAVLLSLSREDFLEVVTGHERAGTAAAAVVAAFAPDAPTP